MAEDRAPDQATLEAHLESGRFLKGVEAGRWSVLHYRFPDLYVRVTGKDYGSGRTFSHDFRLECAGFPAVAPFVERWAFGSPDAPGHRPAAPKGSPGVQDAMKDWKHNGQPGGIYRAWQRHAGDHNGWTQKRPDEAWHRERHLEFIMEALYALMAEQAQWLALQEPVPA